MDNIKTLTDVINEALQGVEIYDMDLFLDFLTFSIERDAPYLRGETKICHEPEDMIRAYIENLKASGRKIPDSVDKEYLKETGCFLDE